MEEPEIVISDQKMETEPEEGPESVSEEDRTNQCQICLKVFNDLKYRDVGVKGNMAFLVTLPRWP